MDLRSLGVFVEVVRRGGFTAASSKVALTQPSISRVIKQLEDDIGQVLITRQHRSIVLTDAGKILFRHAQNLLRDHAALETELADLAGLRRGVLTLGIPPLSGTLFVPLIKRYKKTYPDIELVLFEKGSKATERALLAADMQLGTLILPLDSALYDSVPFFHDRLALAAPLHSHWAKRESVKLKELKDEPFIIFPEDFALNDTVRNACAAAGFTPEIAASSSHFSLIAGLIDSGVGIALLPMSVVRGTNAVAVIRLEEPDIQWNIAIAWCRDFYLSHAAKALVNLVKAHPVDP